MLASSCMRTLATVLLAACAATPAPSPEAGGLSTEQVKRVVAAHQGAIRTCYELEATRTSAPPGTLEMSWTIEPSGKVSDAKIDSSTLYDARAEACILRQVLGLRFPASAAPTRVDVFPFRFDQKQ
jgi:hypothetical protein